MQRISSVFLVDKVPWHFLKFMMYDFCRSGSIKRHLACAQLCVLEKEMPNERHHGTIEIFGVEAKVKNSYDNGSNSKVNEGRAFVGCGGSIYLASGSCT